MHVALEVCGLLLQVLYFYLESFVRLFVPEKKKVIEGQNVLVTGAGRGIGRALAVKFSAQYANIALWDLDKDGLKETADDLKLRGATVFTYECDVTNKEAVKKAASEVRRDMGDIDILVNNAGVLVGKEFLKLEEKDIRKTFEVNTISHFWTVQEFLPAMIAKNRGHIITIASMAARAGTPLLVDYCASKFAAYGFTEALRAELYTSNPNTQIRTTTVCPLFVNTALIMGAEVKERVSYRDRFGKLLEADDVAQAVVEGVLSNNVYVYVPSTASNVNLLNAILPQKALIAFQVFLDCRFVTNK